MSQINTQFRNSPIMETKRRVVVTGLGLICPVGNGVDSAWHAILQGESGIRVIDSFDSSLFPCRIGGMLHDFNPLLYMSSKLVRNMDQFIIYGIAASKQAIADAALEITEANATRVGVAMSSGTGGMERIEATHKILLDKGPKRISPFFIPGSIINMIAGNLSIEFGMRGPSYSVVTACASGTHSIGNAARMIERGDVDVMVAGGAEKSSTPLGLAGFAASRALSLRNDDPTAASRPWDRGRDGFVLGDGAGCVVLESLDHARNRGARIYAELAGFAMNCDAHHITLPPEDGRGGSDCMRLALSDAGINPTDIQYINAHGTSTPMGDVIETRAIKRVFGAHAKNLAVSSTKSMIGHLLGAAGGVEAVFTLLAIRDNIAPPTINLEDPDDECDLDYVPKQAREMRIDVALTNSFGFGGTNGSLIFKRLP